jgi:hypothetical protein
VRALGVVACLGVPLVTRAGLALGSCCVYDMKPRDWSEHDIETLRALGAVAIAEMQRLAAVTASDETSDAIVRYLGAAIDTIDTLARVTPSQCDTSRITGVSKTAATVARQFGTLARPLPPSGSVELAVTAHDVWRLLQIVAGEGASVTLDVAEGLPAVTVDQARIVRLLVTLVAGARREHWRAPRRSAVERRHPQPPTNCSIVCGGQVATHDDTIAVALLRSAERGPDRLE